MVYCKYVKVYWMWSYYSVEHAIFTQHMITEMCHTLTHVLFTLLTSAL